MGRTRKFIKYKLFVQIFCSNDLKNQNLMSINTNLYHSCNVLSILFICDNVKQCNLSIDNKTVSSLKGLSIFKQSNEYNHLATLDPSA